MSLPTALYDRSMSSTQYYSDARFCSCFYRAKKVMFYRRLFVCLFAALRKKYSTDVHKIRWKGGTRATKKPLDFGGNLDHIGFG